ncbi:MAG: MFS transporter [Bacillota bacterium]
MLEKLSIIIKRKDYQNVNLLLFSSGKLISLFGTSIYSFAVGLYLLKMTGSGLTFATNLVLYTLPMIFINPIAGVIADKINKKVIVVGSDLLNSIFLAFIYFLSIKIGLSVPLIYISTLIMTILAAFFNMGIESAKPNLVSDEKLVTINSQARVIESISQIIGPLLGGLIYVLLDMKLFILINAISFFIAAVIELFINFNYNKEVENKDIRDKSTENNKEIKEKIKTKFFDDLKEGYRYLFSRKDLKSLVSIFVAINFFFNFSVVVPLPYLLNNIWKINSTHYGIIQGALPVGMIIGALLVNKIMEKISYYKLLKIINLLAIIGVIAFAIPLIFTKNIPPQSFILIYYSIIMFISGIIVALVDVPANVLLQRIVPSRILGRVISVKFSIIKIIVPISLLLSGYLLNLISILYIFTIGVLLFTLFNIFFFRKDNVIK